MDVYLFSSSAFVIRRCQIALAGGSISASSTAPNAAISAGGIARRGGQDRCQIALAGSITLRVQKDKTIASAIAAAAHAACIIVDYEEFSDEDLELLLRSNGRCRVILLMDVDEMESRARDYRGRAQCLNIFFLEGLAESILPEQGPSSHEAAEHARPQYAGQAYHPEGLERMHPDQPYQSDRTDDLACCAGFPADSGIPDTTTESSTLETPGQLATPGVLFVGGASDPLSSYKRRTFLDRIAAIAQTKADILLIGESGAGKSWLAEKIYRESGRQGNFLSESLANISPSLFESELFGTVAGAYTDAVTKMGLLEAVGNGTLFLDEIAELPLQLQPKLFSALDRRTFRKVGSLKEQPFQGRLIFATNRDLDEAVREGSFREELYNRISMVTIRVPPLREHPHDIPALAARFAADEGKSLSKGALEKLEHYRYPGNIRELKHIVYRSCLLSRRGTLEADDISFARAL